MSRRRRRCGLGVVSAMLSLLQQDDGLLAGMVPITKFKMRMTLDEAS
jgi:hypothetical protein